MRNIIMAALVIATAVAANATGIPGVAGGSKKFALNNSVGKNAIEFISDAPAETINGTSEGVTGSFDSTHRIWKPQPARLTLQL